MRKERRREYVDKPRGATMERRSGLKDPHIERLKKRNFHFLIAWLSCFLLIPVACWLVMGEYL